MAKAPRTDIKEVWIEYKKTQDRGAAQHPDGELSPPGALQRRAHPRQAARRGGAGRPDVRRHLRPDGRHQRLRPRARRQVRDLLRPAHPRRDPRRAALDGLGAAPGPLPRPQARRRQQAARSRAGPAADQRRGRQAAATSPWPSSRRWPRTPAPSAWCR